MKAYNSRFKIPWKKVFPFFCCFMLSILAINSAYSQNHGYIPQTAKGYTYKRIAADSTFSFVTGCGTPSLRNGTDELAALYFDSCSKTMYVFDPSDSTWGAAGNGASECYRDVLIDSSNFSDDTKFTDATLAGTMIYAIFWNDVPAFIYEGTEYTLVDSGATIDVADFNATDSNYHFHVYAIDTSGTCANSVTINGGSGGIDDITGLIEAGTNVTLDGAGTSGDPYIINSSGSGAQDLQSVTDIGNTTDNNIIVNDGASGQVVILKNVGGEGQVDVNSGATFNTSHLKPGSLQIINDSAIIEFSSLSLYRTYLKYVYPSQNNNLYLPDKSGTLATQDDIDRLLLRHVIQTLTPANTVNIDLNDGYLGTLLLNRAITTLAFSNINDGDEGWVEITQDGTGNRDVVLPAGSTVPNGFGGGTSPTISTGPGKIDRLYYSYNNSVYRWTVVRDYQ